MVLLFIFVGASNSFQQPTSSTPSPTGPSFPSPNPSGDRKFLPPIFDSKVSDWGCCRICSEEEENGSEESTESSERPVLKKAPIVIYDAAKFVNCCPLCPWPPARNKALGGLQYYFEPHYPQAKDVYEKQLAAFPPHPDAPPVRPPAEHEFQGLMAKDISAQNPADFFQMSEVPKEYPDPLAKLRGKETTKDKTAVYGSPANYRNDQMSMDMPPKADLPPCCTVCKRQDNSIDPTQDNGCCMICKATVAGSGDTAAWRPKRKIKEYLYDNNLQQIRQ